MKKILFSVLTLFLFWATASVFAQTIHYVKENGTGNGSSWINASGDLQAMINLSAGGDQVWVAKGTYKPKYRADNMSDANPYDRNNAFVLKKDVKIYGGFAGINETNLTQRDFTRATNNTILSGAIGTAGNSNNGENAYHVVINSGDLGVAELNGFTISSGNGSEAGSIHVNGHLIYNMYGGGIHNTYSSPILSNITIRNNSAQEGGGIYNSISSPVLTNVIISGNSATGSGGGIANSYSPSLSVLTNVVINGNTAKYAGGIYNSYSSLVLTNVIISGNTTTTDSRDVIYNVSNTGASNQRSSLDIRNSIIYGNSGGIKNDNSTLTIKFSLVQGSTDVTNGNIDGNTDPLFVSPVAQGLSTGGDYRLKPTSPAINVGNNSYFNAGQTPNLSAINTDLDGNARIQGGTIDLGAYESNIPAAVAGTISGAATVCEGSNSTLTLSGYTGNIQWQESLDNVTFNDIPGETEATYTTFDLYVTRWYRAVVTSGGINVTSPSVVITVNRKAPKPLSGYGGNPICSGEEATLWFKTPNTRPNAIFKWYTDAACTPPAAATADAFGFAYVFPTVTTTYYGRYEDLAPCNSVTGAITATVTVKPNTSAGTVTAGTSTQCIGSTTTYTVSGVILGEGTGAWSSDNEAVAAVDPSTGLVTAIGQGTCNIVYTVTGGCPEIQTASQPYTVRPNASAGTVTPGTSPQCIGSTTTYAVSGVMLSGGTGAWSSDNTAIANVDPTSGLVTAVGRGTCNIIYTIIGGCGGIQTASQPYTVTPNASAGTVYAGTNSQCIGSNTTYTVSGVILSGGTGAWNSDNTAIANVDPSSGFVTSVGRGTCNIIYTVTGGCGGIQTASQPYTVNIPPSVTTSNSNPHLYFGAPGDQTSTITASATGGTAPYTITFSMNRALIYNYINAAGKEVWKSTGSTTSSAYPPSTFTGIADGGSASINVTLLADADITITVTDANGCSQTAPLVQVGAEDARCFAGNSGNAKVLVCHVSGNAKNPKREEICVAPNAVQAHLNHGDMLGGCKVNVRNMNLNVAGAIEIASEQAKKEVEEVLGKLSVTVMPNPSSHEFTFILKSLSKENVKLIVTDITGRVIEQKTGVSANSTIRLGDKYSPGIYIAKLLQGNDEVTLQLIKGGK